MQGADAFLTLAEFSIALAGFTSVVVVFANRGGEFSSIDRFRVQGALWSSLGPAVLAFAPIAFDLFGLSETGIWRASSALFCAYLIALLGLQTRRVASLTAADRAILGNGFTVRKFETTTKESSEYEIMNSIQTLTTFFGWCTVINIGILFGLLVRGVIVRKFAAKSFGVSTEEVKAAYMGVFMDYRNAILFLNFTPFVVLKIMA